MAAPVRVGLFINEVEIDHVQPAPAGSLKSNDEVRTFRFRLRDMWQYCGPDDQVSVRADGVTLPMAGRGMFYRPRNQGQRPLSELQHKLAAGYLFASNGRLNESKATDVVWQKTMLGLYEHVSAAITKIIGYDTFLIYGSLLGAVREGTFIGHDFDLDGAYVSRHRDPDLAGIELGELALALTAMGFEVESRLVCLHIRHPDFGKERIDIFHLFFDDSDELQFTWGVAGIKPFRLEQWQGTTEVPFAGTRARIPLNAEALVETMYGPNWRIPNPGFQWAEDRTKQTSGGRIPARLGLRANWQDYWVHHGFDDPSSFSAVVLGSAELPHTVFDLGCGDGRDAAAFIGRGHRVVGLDLVESGVAAATKRLAALPDTGSHFAVCDFDDPQALTDTVTAQRAEGEPALFYGRFLLHAIRASTEDRVFTALASVSRPGDVLALEFRTEADADLPKASGRHYRRFVPEATVRNRLGALGFEVDFDERGTGLAPWGKEDPFLCRLVARRRPVDPDAAADTGGVLDAVRGTGRTATLRQADAAAPSVGYQPMAAHEDVDAGVKAVAFALIDEGFHVRCDVDGLAVWAQSGAEPRPHVRVAPDDVSGPLALRPETHEEVYWADFYAHTRFSGGSTFFESVVGTEGVPSHVVDLGCGNGRDAFAFAASGSTVLGVDRSHIGVNHAEQAARKLKHAGTARFEACDVGDPERLRATLAGAVDRAGQEPVLFYARFFLHSLPADVQRTLLEEVSRAARPGDWFAAEFRTEEDAQTHKVYDNHYRRYQNGPAFARQLEADYGFAPFATEEGTGLSPYQGEDPHLFRVLARRVATSRDVAAPAAAPAGSPA